MTIKGASGNSYSRPILILSNNMYPLFLEEYNHHIDLRLRVLESICRLESGDICPAPAPLRLKTNHVSGLPFGWKNGFRDCNFKTTFVSNTQLIFTCHSSCAAEFHEKGNHYLEIFIHRICQDQAPWLVKNCVSPQCFFSLLLKFALLYLSSPSSGRNDIRKRPIMSSTWLCWSWETSSSEFSHWLPHSDWRRCSH